MIYLHLYLMTSETPHPIIQKLSILACCLYLYTADIVLSVSMHTLNNILRDYYMIFFIPALVSARDSHIFYIDVFQVFTFILQKRFLK